MVLTETAPLVRHDAAPGVRLTRLRRLLDVSVALNALNDTGRLLDYIAATTAAVLDCEAASVLLYDEGAGALRFSAASGAAGAALVGSTVPLGGSLAGTVFREDRILHAVDAAADARRYRAADDATGFVTRSLLGVPMRIDGRPVGVLQALNPNADAFTRDDAEALLIVAAQAAVAIRDARQQEALRHANAQLAELDRLKTNFLAITSHELRTPLTAVIGYGQILAEEVRGDLHAHARAVLDASARMMDLVETLDVMSGVEGGARPTALVSVSALVGGAVRAAGDGAALALPPGPLLVDGDGPRLRLAFANLVRNAVQFSDAGGAVRVGAEGRDGEARVWVADAGRGLAAADLERIFEPYVQVADPDGRDHEGIGVGLAVARSVFARHGGAVWAESAGPGRGATFHVRLPLADLP